MTLLSIPGMAQQVFRAFHVFTPTLICQDCLLATRPGKQQTGHPECEGLQSAPMCCQTCPFLRVLVASRHAAHAQVGTEACSSCATFGRADLGATGPSDLLLGSTRRGLFWLGPEALLVFVIQEVGRLGSRSLQPRPVTSIEPGRSVKGSTNGSTTSPNPSN
jgi:hypothetical protein